MPTDDEETQETESETPDEPRSEPAATSFTIRSGPFALQRNSEVTGEMSVTLRQNGRCTFQGDLHNAGMMTYNVDVAFVVLSSSGRAFSFTKSGRVSGLATGERTFLWTDTLENGEVTRDWAALFEDCTFRWRAAVDASPIALIQEAIDGFPQKHNRAPQVVHMTSGRKSTTEEEP